MIPFINFKDNNNSRCEFIHANGFPPNAYKSLFDLLLDDLDINAMVLRPHWKENPEIENFKTTLDLHGFLHGYYLKAV